MNVKEAKKKGIEELKKANIEEPIIKIRMILSFVLNKTKEFIMAHEEYNLNEEEEKEFFDGIEKLRNNIPIEYITHNKEFMKLNFYVNEDVLIPREDTEILVEEIIDEYKNKDVKILDLCTGSGCIGISLKKYMANANVSASDISGNALKVAKLNAKNNNVEINFILSDMFKNIKEKDFDIIVSNPPYIKTEVIKTLNKDVQNEPSLALDGGEDGLFFYKKIIKEAYGFLKNYGMIFLEIGYDQKQDLINIVKEDKRYKLVKVKTDLENNDRVVMIRKG